MAKTARANPPKLADVCKALQSIAPLELAQSWDNVGLLAGDETAAVRSALLCIDLTPEVATEAVAKRVDLVAAYHPPIFKPVARLTAQSSGPEAAVFKCIAAGIGVYAMHTALDAADCGTNDVIADLCGIKETEPLEYVFDLHEREYKLVTFVPPANLEIVAETMFAAGAGRIGDYSKCSYRLEGHGTFLGSDATNPTVGKPGQFEAVNEVRLETVCPESCLAAVTAALIQAHPYEEPAFDIYPLRSAPTRGIGRQGDLPRPIALAALARRLKKKVSAASVQIVGRPTQKVGRAIIVVGAAGSLPFTQPLGGGDAIITGEIRHHDALSIKRLGCAAIALGHWTSERPVLQVVAKRLEHLAPGLRANLSRTDKEPFQPIM